MKIDATGMARDALRDLRAGEANAVRNAIGTLHDALLAVALGHVSVEEIRELFWNGTPSTTCYFGGYLTIAACNPRETPA